MKFKKIISSALAAALALSLSVPALAASNTATSLQQNTAITGDTKVPTISITVPDAGAVTVNPYKMEVTVKGNKVTDQIISATQYIVNASDVDLNVSASVTGTVSGTATLATATTQGTKAVTTNSVFMYFEIAAATADDGTGDPTWATAYDAKNAGHILVSTKATKKDNVITLGASDGSTDTYAAFHLAGDAASAPTTAWTDADKVNVAIAFTFTPTASKS